MFAPLLLALVPLAPPQGPQPGPDWIIPAGTAATYDTFHGPLRLDSLSIEPGAVLRVVGPAPFEVHVRGTLTIRGTLDLGGAGAQDVATTNTGNLPEPGAPGMAGGGSGGTASWQTTTSTPGGQDGWGPYSEPSPQGGRGGQSAYATGLIDYRRPGGGGGGALGPADPTSIQPGLIPWPGADGHPLGLDAPTGQGPAAGGPAGAPLFTDGNPTNDFWGIKRVGVFPHLIVGELHAPVPGSGGGAGGDALPSNVFPTPAWTPESDEKGAGGGGGGGLALIQARRLILGGGGRILANGGAGAAGEWLSSAGHIGGSSGGGSGGYLVLQARVLDLSQADGDCLQARGGAGGPSAPGGYSAGGDGGPGVIQLHGARSLLHLPPGVDLADLSVPDAHLLLPMPLTP